MSEYITALEQYLKDPEEYENKQTTVFDTMLDCGFEPATEEIADGDPDGHKFYVLRKENYNPLIVIDHRDAIPGCEANLTVTQVAEILPTVVVPVGSRDFESEEELEEFLLHIGAIE